MNRCNNNKIEVWIHIYRVIMSLLEDSRESLENSREYSITYTNGKTENITLPLDQKYIPLKDMQMIVGGYIEIVSTGGELFLIVNEIGLIKGLPFNKKIFDMWHLELFGNVIICHKSLVE